MEGSEILVMGKIGEMNRKIDIQESTTTKSAAGAPLKIYTHKFWLWAKRTPAADGPETYVNARLVVPKRYLYEVHETASLSETMRIVDEGISYNIVMINPSRDKSILMMDLIAEKITV